ncbi:MAG: SDR family NAD(P)-dependent oxidoreductase [Planctomycetota bacterium]|nr:SDR family NAD(P)-dependent oxidoreductase [Planctomycetota bacterium]MEC8653213.1 SDR family NAD(P)-dependent oxidoreductase [Planctomycetota bacterium]MEC9048635.1 SDR family NAD(P)-dependent oxidoreductase [Planctomycetota bacterium]
MKASATKGAPLRGRRCLVTGGGSGIGEGIAHRLAAAGASVAVLGRRRKHLNRVVEALNAKKATAVAVTGDVTDEAGIGRAVSRAAKALGGLDVLVNNAGVGGPNACALDGPERWDDVVRPNLDGVFFTSRAALKHLSDGGRIVNISSVLGRFGVPGYTAYCASKHGVIGLTKALALELAPREITVNAICPGWVDTDMATDGLELMASGMGVELEEARRQAMAMVPLGRILQPEEIGDLVVYLASHGARGMTGQAISHCGGQVMW